MYKYLLLIILACSQISCKESPKADAKEVLIFYGTIEESFIKYYAPQHLFMQRATDAVNEIKANNDAVIDTKQLRIILADAKKACYERMRIVASVKEVDESIGYKNAVAKSIDVFSKACDKEFKHFIDLLDIKTENKLDKLTQIVQSKLYEIETAAKECESAANELKTKYNIEIKN
ncbi:MAG: hypothetical protein ACOVO1_03455 [Chitinophagaceae bacterium]